MPFFLASPVALPGAKDEQMSLLWDECTGNTDAEGDGWFVEMPAIMKLIRAVERGEITATDMANTLADGMAMHSTRSGCCPTCDGSIDSYHRYLADYETGVAAERAEDEKRTPESHPFIIGGSGLIHAWNCTTRLRFTEHNHPGATVQEFVHENHGGIYFSQTSGGHAVRVTTDEIVKRMRGRKIRRCKVCAPVLPVFASEASDVEATGRS